MILLNNKSALITPLLKFGELRIDSRWIAEGLGIQHKNILELIENYKADFEEFGTFAFETRKSGGRPERFVFLNEDQSYLLLTFSKNTPNARGMKKKLVKSFRVAIESMNAKADYLPCYRECHDAVGRLVRKSGSSQPERIHHLNVEKMINKAFRIPSGVRSQLPASIRSCLSVAELLAGNEYKRSIESGGDHKGAKSAVFKYSETVVGVLPILPKSSPVLEEQNAHF